MTDCLLSELHDLALRVAPELSSWGLYVIRQPETLPAPEHLRGYVVKGPCALIQKHLQDTGEWRGPGPTIVLVGDMTRDEAIEIVLHECAHILPASSPPAVVEVKGDVLEVERLAMSAWAIDPVIDPTRPRWAIDNHHQAFHRVVLHLWWRAALLGEVVDLESLCAGLKYDLSPAFLYWRALGNEAVRMRDATFAEILASEPPKLFSDYWYADLADWMTRHPEAVKP